MSDDTYMELARAREIVGWAYNAAKDKGDPEASKWALVISGLGDLMKKHEPMPAPEPEYDPYDDPQYREHVAHYENN